MSIAQLPLVDIDAPMFWINTNVIVVVITKLIFLTITPDGYGSWKTLGEALHSNPFRIAAVCLILSIFTSVASGIETSLIILSVWSYHCKAKGAYRWCDQQQSS